MYKVHELREMLGGQKGYELLIPSHALERVETTPIFFYHMPKTAGLMFRFGIGFGQKSETSRWPNRKGVIFSLGETYSEEVFNLPYDSICAWMPFGFHKRIGQSFNLFTTFREPFARIVSRYRYHCNLRRSLPNAREFQAFYRHPSQSNHQTKLLAGLGDSVNVDANVDADDVDERALEQAFKHLDHFYGYTTIDKMNRLLETVISLYRLPTLYGQRNNVSPSWALLEWDTYRDEILSYNTYDSRLFEHVSKHDKIPNIDLSENDQVHKNILITKERNQEGRFENYVESTASLMARIGGVQPIA